MARSTSHLRPRRDTWCRLGLGVQTSLGFFRFHSRSSLPILAGPIHLRQARRHRGLESWLGVYSAAVGGFILMLIGGFVVLLFGAESLVRGASKLAVALGLSPLVVGLTIVAMGTSAPEVTVSISSAWRGQADIAIGNVVGSNIFNVLFILGLAATITPLVVDRRLIRLDVPLMIGAAGLLWIMGLDGELSRIEGAVLFSGLVGYIVHTLREARKDPPADQEAIVAERTPRAFLIDAAYILAGFALLILGSKWLVDGAVGVARALGVSELIIGLTIVAAGTGMPELATSIVAAIRGQRDIAVGNVVGSNIFNILAVVGLTGLVSPKGLPVSKIAVNFDIPVMTAAVVICLPIFFTGQRISRLEGLLFLGYYASYVAYLILDSGGHDSLGAFSDIMLFAVLPLTVLIVGITTVHSFIENARDRRTGSTSPSTPPPAPQAG